MRIIQKNGSQETITHFNRSVKAVRGSSGVKICCVARRGAQAEIDLSIDDARAVAKATHDYCGECAWSPYDPTIQTRCETCWKRDMERVFRDRVRLAVAMVVGWILALAGWLA